MICTDPARDHGLIMVVEHPKDLAAFERTGRFKGVYHVLLGRLSPHDGSGPEHISAAGLVARVQKGERARGDPRDEPGRRRRRDRAAAREDARPGRSRRSRGSRAASRPAARSTSRAPRCSPKRSSTGGRRATREGRGQRAVSLDLRLNQRLDLSLKLAPQIIQSIELLQLPAMDLMDVIEAELDTNEFLEMVPKTETPLRAKRSSRTTGPPWHGPGRRRRDDDGGAGWHEAFGAPRAARCRRRPRPEQDRGDEQHRLVGADAPGVGARAVPDASGRGAPRRARRADHLQPRRQRLPGVPARGRARAARRPLHARGGRAGPEADPDARAQGGRGAERGRVPAPAARPGRIPTTSSSARSSRSTSTTSRRTGSRRSRGRSTSRSRR